MGGWGTWRLLRPSDASDYTQYPSDAGYFGLKGEGFGASSWYVSREIATTLRSFRPCPATVLLSTLACELVHIKAIVMLGQR